MFYLHSKSLDKQSRFCCLKPEQWCCCCCCQKRFFFISRLTNNRNTCSVRRTFNKKGWVWNRYCEYSSWIIQTDVRNDQFLHFLQHLSCKCLGDGFPDMAVSRGTTYQRTRGDTWLLRIKTWCFINQTCTLKGTHWHMLPFLMFLFKPGWQKLHVYKSLKSAKSDSEWVPNQNQGPNNLCKSLCSLWVVKWNFCAQPAENRFQELSESRAR